MVLESGQDRVVLRASPRRLPVEKPPIPKSDETSDRKSKRWSSFPDNDVLRSMRYPCLQMLHRFRNLQRSTLFVWVLTFINGWMFVSLSHETYTKPDFPQYVQNNLPIKFHKLQRVSDGTGIRARKSTTAPIMALRKIPRAIQVKGDALDSVNELQLWSEFTNQTHREVFYRKHEPKRVNDLDPFPAKGCEIMGEWQVSHRPTCTLIHEMDLKQRPYCQRHLNDTAKLYSSYIVGGGLYRNAWMVREYNGTKVALKTLLYKNEPMDLRHYDRHRRDAIAMEQLTASPYVLDVFAHCGHSVVTEFANGGEIYGLVGREHEPKELLDLAHHVATSVLHAHNYDENGRATIAHTDLHSGNWIKVNERYKINDFNRARFLTWNRKKSKHCAFRLLNNSGKFRAPEEYNYDAETEKVDVYALGHLLRSLMIQKWPEDFVDTNEWKERVARGQANQIDDEYRNSDNFYTRALVKAIDLALVTNPDERASAKEIADTIRAALAEKQQQERNDI